MKHYTLLKLAPGADATEVQSRIKKAYDKLDNELDWANRPVVYRTCAEDGKGMDIMAVIEIDTAEQLRDYYQNSHCVKLAEKLGDSVAEKITFDHY